MTTAQLQPSVLRLAHKLACAHGGVVADLLAELFSSRIRAAVLGHVLPRSHLGFSLTELSRQLGLPISSLQHECYKLERINVLTGRREGNSRRYRVNGNCAILSPLTHLIAGAIGQEACLRGAMDGVPGLDVAFLAGALPPANATDPVHLVLVGEVPLEILDAACDRVQDVLAIPPGRIELAFYRPDDWHARLEQHNPLVTKLLTGPRINLMGDG